ncbi:MAG: hypothetical protein R2715_07185 [Ilumatobacteraceae bacterium]
MLLRTATSLHYNAMDVVDAVSNTAGVSNDIKAVGAAYKEMLTKQAAAPADATTAGARPTPTRTR